MQRILLIGYVYGLRSERRLCSEVHINLAYLWFCRLVLEGAVPDHSTFSKDHYGRSRESDISWVLFEDVVGQCSSAGLVSGEGFAVDGSLIDSDATPLRDRGSVLENALLAVDFQPVARAGYSRDVNKKEGAPAADAPVCCSTCI